MNKNMIIKILINKTIISLLTYVYDMYFYIPYSHT